MKCPFSFANSDRTEGMECDYDCFLRIAVRKVGKDGSKKLIGHTCAIATIAASNLPDDIELTARLETI